MKVLLFAPDLVGHPQVYLRVMTRALLDADADVVIAAPSGTGEWTSEWPLLAPFVDDPRVSVSDLRTLGNGLVREGVVTVEGIVDIQTRHSIDSTLFLEADKSNEQFLRIVAGEAPRLRGRNHAIFANTTWWYPGEDPYTGILDPARAPTIGGWLRRVKRRTLTDPLDQRLFYDRIIDASVFDSVLVKDERVAQWHRDPVVWMPEIYKVFDAENDDEPGADWHAHAEPIEDFVAAHGADRVVLFFGAGAWYKGYDRFVQLLAADDSLAGLHVGAPIRFDPEKPFDAGVEHKLARLRGERRIYETSCFVETQQLIDLSFSIVTRFVSTHRLLLSSGTCLQALDYGKSILTPAAGLVGWRTQEHALGATYDHTDAGGQSLASAVSDFADGRFDASPEAIVGFIARFSREAVEEFFQKLLVC